MFNTKEMVEIAEMEGIEIEQEYKKDLTVDDFKGTTELEEEVIKTFLYQYNSYKAYLLNQSFVDYERLEDIIVDFKNTESTITIKGSNFVLKSFNSCIIFTNINEIDDESLFIIKTFISA